MSISFSLFLSYTICVVSYLGTCFGAQTHKFWFTLLSLEQKLLPFLSIFIIFQNCVQETKLWAKGIKFFLPFSPVTSSLCVFITCFYRFSVLWSQVSSKSYEEKFCWDLVGKWIVFPPTCLLALYCCLDRPKLLHVLYLPQ